VSFFAATAVVLSATPSFAATSIELTDKRSENQNGLQLIYEVRAPRPSRVSGATVSRMDFVDFYPPRMRRSLRRMTADSFDGTSLYVWY
jgi:hypothetical protein